MSLSRRTYFTSGDTLNFTAFNCLWRGSGEERERERERRIPLVYVGDLLDYLKGAEYFRLEVLTNVEFVINVLIVKLSKFKMERPPLVSR